MINLNKTLKDMNIKYGGDITNNSLLYDDSAIYGITGQKVHFSTDEEYRNFFQENPQHLKQIMDVVQMFDEIYGED